MNRQHAKRQTLSSSIRGRSLLFAALVFSSTTLLLSGCTKQASSAPPEGTADLTGTAVYGWTICAKWNALIYSDGRDLIWQDRQTGRRINLTAPLAEASLPSDIKKALFSHAQKLPQDQKRQKGSELYPACSPDGSLVAFAAVRANANKDPGDDADSDIWAIRLDAQLVEDLKAGRSLSRNTPIPQYFGPLHFVQLTNLAKTQETMPSFTPDGRHLLFLGRDNHLWSKAISTR